MISCILDVIFSTFLSANFSVTGDTLIRHLKKISWCKVFQAFGFSHFNPSLFFLSFCTGSGSQRSRIPADLEGSIETAQCKRRHAQLIVRQPQLQPKPPAVTQSSRCPSEPNQFAIHAKITARPYSPAHQLCIKRSPASEQSASHKGRISARPQLNHPRKQTPENGIAQSQPKHWLTAHQSPSPTAASIADATPASTVAKPQQCFIIAGPSRSHDTRSTKVSRTK